MASYKKIANGNWKYTISYTDNNGNYRQKSKQGFPTKTAAKEVAEPLEIKLKANVHLTDADMLFTDYYSNWIKTYKIGMFSPETDKIYRTAEKLVQANFGRLKLRQVSKDKYQQFISDYSEGRSKETVRKIHNKVAACLRHAFHSGSIPIDVTHKITIKGNAGMDPEAKYIEEHELKALVIAIKDGLTFNQTSRYMLLLQASTGARIGEIMALTFDSFDFKNQTIRINKSFDYKNTKDIKDTKNGVHRVIDIDDDTIRMIKPYYDYKRKQSLTSILNNSRNLLFVDDYMRVISPEAVNKSLARACKRAGIKRITSHGLRHTHASMLLTNGVPIQIVAERLGDTVEVVTSVYAHVLQKMRDKNKELVQAIAQSMFN
ncbi:tyrosine-type recombinase/integrase [Jeotgalibaca porci]|uniref:tyrosine-type recombinase/integrase n=1 Tax=Jeotgalibaca porci TaxID=1868793 RepID=UPI00359FE954